MADIWNVDGWLDGSAVRRARKQWKCAGDGAGPRTRLYACTGESGEPVTIMPGDQYLEYFGESRPYEHGTAHCMACARAFYRKPPED